MKGRSWRSAVLSSAVFLALSGGARSQETKVKYESGDIFGCPGSSWPWPGQGPFVNVPAGLAASPGGVLGTALAIVLSPADLIDMAAGHRTQDYAIPRFAHGGVCAGIYLGKGLALAVGSPFWLLKQAFWDGPKKLFSREESGELQSSSH